jgi:hypothetical protein
VETVLEKGKKMRKSEKKEGNEERKSIRHDDP